MRGHRCLTCAMMCYYLDMGNILLHGQCMNNVVGVGGTRFVHIHWLHGRHEIQRYTLGVFHETGKSGLNDSEQRDIACPIPSSLFPRQFVRSLFASAWRDSALRSLHSQEFGRPTILISLVVLY